MTTVVSFQCVLCAKQHTDITRPQGSVQIA